MEKIRSLVFTIVASLCLLTVLGGVAVDSFSNDDGAARKSELENRYYAKFPKVTRSSVAKGEFQAGLESWLADMVPNRDAVILANAAMQRASIAIAAKSFGFEVYLTFFNSEFCVVPKDELVIAKAQLRPERDEHRRIKAWIKTLNEAARKHEDIRFVYDCVARHDQTVFNPTYDLMSGELVSAEWVQDYLISKLDPRIQAFVDSVDSYDEIKGKWLRAEEHWTFERAVESYNKIAERLSLDKHEIEESELVAEGWFGDYSRTALDLDYRLDLTDEARGYPDLTFYALGDFGGKEITVGRREAVRNGTTSFAPGDYHCYTRYYGAGSAEVANAGTNNGKVAFVICDSLSYPLKRVISSKYERSIFILPGNDRLEGSLESYLERYKPDDVIIILHATKYRSIGGHSPQFVGLKRGGDSDE